MGQVIAVTGRGGTGKSIISANLSKSLVNKGKKVVIVDCDCGMRSLDIIFGVQNEVVYNFNDYITDKCQLSSVVMKFENGLKFIPAPQSINSDEINFELFSDFIDKLKSAYDYVVLDCTATMGESLLKLLYNASILLIVSECNLQCAKVADKLATYAEKIKIDKVYTIINKYSIDKAKNNAIIDIDEILSIIAVPPIGICPIDEQVVLSYKNGKLVADNSKSLCGIAIDNIARRLMGEKVPIISVKSSRVFR